jgi:hypothetical protein
MSQRKCGDCQLCCSLLPVNELAKPALQRCAHQRHGKGCAIYARRPMSCALWSCRWLVDDEAGDLARPDRCHAVVDIIPDVIRMTPPGEEPSEATVLVVWIDPAFPEAHRDAGLRRLIEREGKPALIRIGSSEAIVLFPPCLTGRGWVEHQSGKADPGFKGLPARMAEAARAP